MRIFVVCYEDIGNYIGGVKQVIEVLRHLKLLGHEVQLCAPLISEYGQELDFKIRYVPVLNRGILRRMSYNLLSFWFILFYALRFKADVFLTFEVFFDCASSLAAKALGKRHVMFVNGDLEDFKAERHSGILIRVIDTFRKVNFKRTDKVITVAQELKNSLQARYIDTAGKIRIIGNGVDAQVFRPMDKKACRRSLGLEEEATYVGFLGGMYPWHGLDLLLQSAAIVLKDRPDVKYIIAGDGPMRQSLMRLAKDLDIAENVIFPGRVDFATAPSYINAFDLCAVFFKRVRKNPGCPMKLYEYMACAKPVIASDVEGYGTLIGPQGAGIAVNEADPDGVARNTLRLLGDEGLRIQMGKRAREAVIRSYTWHKTALAVERVLNEQAG